MNLINAISAFDVAVYALNQLQTPTSENHGPK